MARPAQLRLGTSQPDRPLNAPRFQGRKLSFGCQTESPSQILFSNLNWKSQWSSSPLKSEDYLGSVAFMRGEKRSPRSQRRNNLRDDEYPRISGCMKRTEHLKAQLLRKLADTSERDNHLEGKGCFVLINIDLGVAICGRSSCSNRSVRGHLWPHGHGRNSIQALLAIFTPFTFGWNLALTISWTVLPGCQCNKYNFQQDGCCQKQAQKCPF